MLPRCDAIAIAILMDIENLVSQSVGSKLCYDTTWRRIARSSARLVWCEDRRESGSVGGQESRRARRLVSSVFSPQHNPPCGSKFGIRNILRKLVRIVEQSHGYRSHRMQFGRWGSFTSMTSSLPLFFRRVWCESVWSVARGTRSLGVIRREAKRTSLIYLGK